MSWKELFNKQKDATGESINMKSSKEQCNKIEQKEESYDVDFYIDNLLKFRKVYDAIEEGKTYYYIELIGSDYDFPKKIDCKEVKIIEKCPIKQIEAQLKQLAKDKWISNNTLLPFSKSDMGQIYIKHEYGHYYSRLYKEKIDFLPEQFKTLDNISKTNLYDIDFFLFNYLIASVELGVHGQTDINSIITQQVINKARKSLVGDVIMIPPYERQSIHKLINGYLLMIDEKPALIYTEDELNRLEIDK